MNSIPASETRCRQRRFAGPARKLRLCGLIVSALVAAVACNAPASEAGRQAQPTSSSYKLEFRVSPLPGLAAVDVELTLKQSSHLLREFRMRAPDEYFSQFSADGSLMNDGDEIVWRPESRGGTLSWRVKVNRERQKRRHGCIYDRRLVTIQSIRHHPAGRDTHPQRGAAARPVWFFRCPSAGPLSPSTRATVTAMPYTIRYAGMTGLPAGSCSAASAHAPTKCREFG